MSRKVTLEEVKKASLEYFKGDELAADVFATKYSLCDTAGNYYEMTPADSFLRHAKDLHRIEMNYKDPLSYEDILGMLNNWEFVLQGGPFSGVGNPYQVQSLSNCFVLPSPLDSYSGIFYTDQQQVQIMKRRGGVGHDISNIRPKGLPTTNAARTTDGISCFMERWSSSTREVAQGGRRGALMMTISVHHPEIVTFIKIKKDRSKVTGANISIKCTDEFMKAVEKGETYQLRFPVDAKHPKMEEWVDAKTVWKEIMLSAWDSAEPGVLFWDTIIEGSPADCYADVGYETISTNPCFAPGTMVHTKTGHFPIETLVGKKVDIWDGEKWVSIDNFRVTGQNQEILKITQEDGSFERVTPSHTVILDNGIRIKAKELLPGMSLAISSAPQSERVKTKDLNRSVVLSVKPDGREEKVYCCTVPSTHSLALSSGTQWGQCSELPLSALDSCRLSFVNLVKFVQNPYTDNAKFDFNRFEEVSYKAQKLMDDLVDLELEAIDRIIDKVTKDPEPDYVKKIELDLWKDVKITAANGRRTGLGITGLGDALAMLGVKYGSDESVKVTGKIYKSLGVASYRSSVDMAESRGAFNVFDLKKEKDHAFLKRVLTQDEELYKKYTKFGRRNIANLTTAPVGSLSTLTQTTSGIEPAIFLNYKRRRKVSPTDRHDFIDSLGDHWQEYEVYHHGVKWWMDYTSQTDVKKSPYYKATAEDIDWEKKVELQAAAQKWIDHAISNTTNLPQSATTKDVEKVYMLAWKSRCKGATVYRAGSRTGVLVNSETEVIVNDRNKVSIVDTIAPKRPPFLECDIHRAKIKGQEHLVIISLLDKKPYEIFAGISESMEFSKKDLKGKLEKLPKKIGGATYNLIVGEMTFKDIVNLFDNPNHGALTRMISTGMRHGVPVKYIVEQLRKDKYSDISSFSRVMARILGKSYIPDGTESTEKTCSQCGSEELAYQEGCVACLQCGYSKCS